MVNNTVYHFVGSNLEVEIFLKKMKHQKKRALKRKIETSLYILYWGFKKISFTLYTNVLAKILLNGAKFIQKLTPGFNNHMRNLDNFRQRVESPKSWNSMGYYFCTKITLTQFLMTMIKCTKWIERSENSTLSWRKSWLSSSSCVSSIIK